MLSTAHSTTVLHSLSGFVDDQRIDSCTTNTSTPSSFVDARAQSKSSGRSVNDDPSGTDTLVLGTRVIVPSLCVIGILRYLGETHFKPGLWAGIELDLEGAGKNNGSVQGVQYFQCPEHTGLFVLASKVQVLPPEQDDDQDTLNKKDDNSYCSQQHLSTATTKRVNKIRRQTSSTTTNSNSSTATSTRSPCKSNTTATTTTIATTSRSTRPKTARACASSTCRSKRRSLAGTTMQKDTVQQSSEKGQVSGSKNHPLQSMDGSSKTAGTATAAARTGKSVPTSPSKSTLTRSTTTTTTTSSSRAMPTRSKSSKSNAASVSPVRSKSTRSNATVSPIESKNTKSNATVSPDKSKSTKINADALVSRSKSTTTRPPISSLKRSKSSRTTSKDTSSSSSSSPSSTVAVVKSKSTRTSLDAAKTRNIMTMSKSSATSAQSSKNKTLQSCPPTSRSTTTRRTKHNIHKHADSSPDEELRRMQELLEESRREREKLAQEMSGKEAAWERIVSTKESYALQVKDKEQEIRRLEQALAASEEKLQALTNQADIQSSQQALLEQQRHRITKLDQLLQEVQAKEKRALEDYRDLQQESAARLDQVKRLLADRDQTVASLEQECDELTRASMAAARTYEESMEQTKAKYTQALEAKDRELEQLRQTLSAMAASQRTQQESPVPEFVADDQKRRLEQQLQSALEELDRERRLVATKTQELDTVKAQLIQLQKATEAFDKRCQALERELQTELQDKGRVMEEVYMVRQAQSDAEEQHLQVELAKQKAEQALEVLKKDALKAKHDYQALATSHNALQESYNQLLRGIAAQDNKANNASLCQQVLQLSGELERQKKQIASLEAENQTLKNALLERQKYASPLSPVSMHSFKRSSLSSMSSAASFSEHEEPLYCEICEVDGHDVMNCTAYLENVSMEMYCVNCDVFGEHTTEDCPSKDEMF